ncbi:peptide chain release factor N(5)-glutamine methyltransferase [Thermophilibacter sp.]
MSQQPWTIKRVLDWTSGYLERKGDEHPRLSAEWLLCHVTGLSRVELYVNFDRPLEPHELDAMHAAIERRAAGEPLQYVTGEMPFRHIVLRCEEGVLIPRPETEVLVDAALEGVDRARAERGPGAERDGEKGAAGAEKDGAADDSAGTEPPVRVLEVGTGTGCIALSIASERPGTLVTATDLSERAAALAERNRDALGLDDAVDVVRCDLASGVDAGLMGSFSVLVSNPPYIPTEVLRTEVPAEVADHEPALALDGGPDGLDVFRRLLELAPRALEPGGTLAVELFEDSLDQAAELARAQGGWASVEVREDLTHRPRVLVAVREG